MPHSAPAADRRSDGQEDSAASVNMNRPMTSIEQQLRSLEEWQEKGVGLVDALQHSLGELTRRLGTAEQEHARLNDQAGGAGAAPAAKIARTSYGDAPAQRGAAAAAGAPQMRPAAAAAAGTAVGAAVGGASNAALSFSSDQLLALRSSVDGLLGPQRSLRENSCALRSRVDVLHSELAALRSQHNQRSLVYVLLGNRDARTVLFEQHFVNLGLAEMTKLCLVSKQFRTWVLEAVAKLPAVVALGGCDEEATNGWSDGDLNSLEILQFGSPHPGKMSPYFCYTKTVRAKFREENPDLKATDLSKLIGATWKALSKEDKAPYFEKAKEASESTVPRWVTAAPSMPQPRGNPAVCCLKGGEIFVAGGEKGHTELGSVSVYSPASCKWESDWPDMRHVKGMARACFVNTGSKGEKIQGATLSNVSCL